MTTTVTMYVGDVRDTLDRLIGEGVTVDHVVTSPPFLALRSYLPADHPDKHREIGSEPTPAAFLDTLYGLTAQLGALVPEWGSVCVELGDTMSGAGGYGSPESTNPAYDQARAAERWEGRTAKRFKTKDDGWPLAKSMCLMPHAYTMGIAYGRNPLTGTPSPAGQWRIRNVIAWARPNPPVGSLGKRNPHTRTGDYKFRPATSYITVACRGTGRYFDLDAVRTVSDVSPTNPRARYPDRRMPSERNGTHIRPDTGSRGDDGMAMRSGPNPAGAPPLDWHTDDLDGDWLWKLATAPYRGSHYATFNLTLPRRLILAMCPERVCTVCGWPSERITGETTYERTDSDRVPARLAQANGHRIAAGVNQHHQADGANTSVIAHRDTTGWTDCGHDAWRTGRVLDCFGGSGTTAVAAALEGRDAILIDIDDRNVALVRQRLNETVRILDEARDGDTITWTVETVSAVELEHDKAGQLGLFGESA